MVWKKVRSGWSSQNLNKSNPLKEINRFQERKTAKFSEKVLKRIYVWIGVIIHRTNFYNFSLLNILKRTWPKKKSRTYYIISLLHLLFWLYVLPSTLFISINQKDVSLKLFFSIILRSLFDLLFKTSCQHFYYIHRL